MSEEATPNSQPEVAAPKKKRNPVVLGVVAVALLGGIFYAYRSWSYGQTHTVTDDGREVKLTAKEFLLLQYLLEHRGRVLSRDRLLSDVWDYSYTGGTRTVDVHVRRLREKLPFLVEALVTVKQFGYRLLEPAPPPAPGTAQAGAPRAG